MTKVNNMPNHLNKPYSYYRVTSSDYRHSMLVHKSNNFTYVSNLKALEALKKDSSPIFEDWSNEEPITSKTISKALSHIPNNDTVKASYLNF